MIIQVEQRHVYGQIKYYPLNELAHQFAALMKQKTFDVRNLEDIRRMGVEIDVHVPFEKGLGAGEIRVFSI
jgi:hypothetical protein